MADGRRAGSERAAARGRIYRYLHRTQSFCGKQDLARALDLSMPTVYQNVNELMELGLIGYSGQYQSTGGRSAKGLAILPGARLTVGISIMDDRLRLTVADLQLKQLAYKRLPFRPEAGAAALAAELERFLDENRVDRARLLGVGIAVPGILSPDSGKLLYAPTLRIQDASLDALYRAIPYPVHVDNDANCGGRAEWFIREHQHNMAYLSLEGGVGGAIFIGDSLYAGVTQRSGEFGHMCIEPGGLPCSCGRRGCLEAYCSVRRIHDAGFTVEAFLERVRAHDPACEILWSDMLRHLAVGINNIHAALDCNVILGGFLSGHIEPWLPLLKSYLADGSFFSGDAGYLQLSTLRSHSSVLGAACHFVQEFIDGV